MSLPEGVLLCLATQKGLEVLRACFPSRRSTGCTSARSKRRGWRSPTTPKSRMKAQAANVPLIPLPDVRHHLLEFLCERKVSRILCVGWRYLIPDAAVRALEGNVVIAHDSLLPKLRGFAPLVTALISSAPASRSDVSCAGTGHG